MSGPEAKAQEETQKGPPLWQVLGVRILEFLSSKAGRISLWALVAGFFVFALGYPLLFVLRGAFIEPAPARVLRPGQTLAEFAREHSVSEGELRRLNGLQDGEEVRPGMVLKLARDGWGLGQFKRLLTDPTSRSWIASSLQLGICTTVLTFIIALPLAFFAAKRDFPGKSVFSMLILVPLILPPFVGAIGIKRMLARFGSVNLILLGLGLIDEPIDFLGQGRFWGVVIMEALHLYPIMYLNLTAAMANVDPSLEEAAASLGDSGLRRFFRVTLPLMMPGIFAGCSLVFVWAFTDLGTPLVFQYQEVVSKRIFDKVQAVHMDPQGYALVVVVLAITAGLFAIGKYLSRRRPVGASTKGAVRAQLMPAVGWERKLAYTLFGVLTAAAIVPHLGVVLEAFADRWFMTVLPESFTLGHLRNAFTHEVAASSVRTSLLLSLASTALDIGLGVALAVFIVRSGSRLAPLVDILAMLPLAVPGIVLAFGYVGAYSGTYSWLSPQENPVILLIVSYSIRRLPYVVRSCVAGLEQTPRVLEEASLSLGAPPLQTLKNISLPLVGAHLIAGGILAFSFAMLEVSDSLILALKEQYYPLTKAIYALAGRLSDGSGVACGLGLFGMLLLATSLWAASAMVGKKLGEMFRA